MLVNMRLLVNELYEYQNPRRNDKTNIFHYLYQLFSRMLDACTINVEKSGLIWSEWQGNKSCSTLGHDT